MLPPAQVFRFPKTASNLVVFHGAGILLGWALLEATGAAAAEVDIYDGTNSENTDIASVSLSSGQSTRDLFSGSGIELRQGLLVNVSVGQALGNLYIVPGTLYDSLLLTEGFTAIRSGAE